jgi:hypothetical protein
MQYNGAAAALIWEEARKAAYANEFRHAETFWAKKLLHKSQVAALKARPTLVPVEPIAKPVLEPVAVRLPKLTIDPSQPGFVWPLAFNHPSFNAPREQITALFAQRSPANSGLQSPNYLLILNKTVEMKSLLSDLVRELPSMSYVEARQFLDSLAYSASQPVPLKVAAK